MAEIVDMILHERGKTHGDYEKDAEIAIGLHDLIDAYISTYGSKYRPYMRHSIYMISFKLARILAGDPDFKEHWLDIAGYATLVAERCSK